MSVPVQSDPPSQDYPLPWSMTHGECDAPAGPSSEQTKRRRVDEPGSVLGQWLREFRDERTGGSSPPPMT